MAMESGVEARTMNEKITCIRRNCKLPVARKGDMCTVCFRKMPKTRQRERANAEARRKFERKWGRDGGQR